MGQAPGGPYSLSAHRRDRTAIVSRLSHPRDTWGVSTMKQSGCESKARNASNHSSLRRSRIARRMALPLMAATLLITPAARADRTKLKPGWNLFSPQQDIELGSKVSKDADRQLPMCNDPQVDAYLNRLGRRLAEQAPTGGDRKSTRLNSSHLVISYAVFCLKKKKRQRATSR